MSASKFFRTSWPVWSDSDKTENKSRTNMIGNYSVFSALKYTNDLSDILIPTLNIQY